MISECLVDKMYLPPVRIPKNERLPMLHTEWKCTNQWKTFSMAFHQFNFEIPSHQTKPANSDPQGWSCTPNHATTEFLQKSVCFEGSNETTTGKNKFSNFPFWPSHFHWHQPQGPLLWQGTMSHLRSYNTASPSPWNNRKGKVRLIASARSVHGDSQRYDQPFFVKNNEK